ncbi:lipopolysaccharide biosynthesis protein [Microbacterium sp. G2-8]|uniref:lipopolysaccharide biosynthesis protein n=1 Tax=Microbacterium sp. G2-8 TaxID=2842454 RepID=UPI001C8AF53E|nr:lipopolysaccharide biosynthesis protein [Microbacterium sp. G2-8]
MVDDRRDSHGELLTSGKGLKPDDLRSHVLRGIGWTVIEKWGIRLVSLGVFVILLRQLDAEDFGVASLTTSVTMILFAFVDAGFSKALVQRKELGPDDATTAFWTSFGIAVVVYAILFFTSPLIASLTGMAELEAMLRVLGLSMFVIALSSVPSALLERDMNFRSLGLRSIFGTVVGAIVAVPMALFGAGAWALIAQTLATMVAGMIALWFSTDWRPRFRYSIPALRGMMSFGLSSLGLELVNRTQQNIDKILVNVLLGPAAGGVYYVAQRAVKLVLELLSSVIGRIGLTTFSKLQDDFERLSRAFLQLTFAAGAIAIPVLCVMAGLADIILPYIAGEGWGDAVVVMQILALSNSLFVICRFDKQALLGAGAPGRAFSLGLMESVVGIALLVIAAPFGLVAVACARVSRTLVTWPYRLYLLKRYAGVRVGEYIFNTVMLLLAVAAPLGLLALASLTPWRDTSPAMWTFAVPMAVVMVAAYYGVLWLICGRQNRKVIRRTFARARR